MVGKGEGRGGSAPGSGKRRVVQVVVVMVVVMVMVAVAAVMVEALATHGGVVGVVVVMGARITVVTAVMEITMMVLLTVNNCNSFLLMARIMSIEVNLRFALVLFKIRFPVLAGDDGGRNRLTIGRWNRFGDRIIVALLIMTTIVIAAMIKVIVMAAVALVSGTDYILIVMIVVMANNDDCGGGGLQ